METSVMVAIVGAGIILLTLVLTSVTEKRPSWWKTK